MKKNFKNVYCTDVISNRNNIGENYAARHSGELLNLLFALKDYHDGDGELEVAYVEPMDTPGEHYLITSPIIDYSENNDTIAITTESGTIYKFQKTEKTEEY